MSMRYCSHMSPIARLTRRQSSALAGKFAAAVPAADSETAAILADLVADLINHANGHPTWLEG